METEELLKLNKKELKTWFLTNNKSGYKSTEKWLKKHHLELYNVIIKNCFDDSTIFLEKILIYLNDLHEMPACPECGKRCTFKGSIKHGLSTYCSSKCVNNSEIIKQKKIDIYHSEEYLNKADERSQKFINTCQINFGVDNPMQCEEVKIKVIETNLKIFGVTCVFQSEEIKDKIKGTNFEKYGVDHLAKSPEHQNLKAIKIKETYNLKGRESIAKKLKISIDDVSIIDDMLTITNYCKKHQSFEIAKSNFYNRKKAKINICTECYPIGDCSSIAEHEILDFIVDELGFEANKYFINKKEIDIFVGSKKIGFEYNGLYWHSEKFTENNYHLNKTNDCEKENLTLFHIFEDDWLFKREIIKSIIRINLGVYLHEINGNDCKIQPVGDNISLTFLKDNCVHNYIENNINIGLFYNNELVSLMTFNKKCIDVVNNVYLENDYEMNSFTNKLNTMVFGAQKMLLYYFIKIFKPLSVIVFADRRFHQIDFYRSLNFKHIENTQPNYWYFKRSELIRYNSNMFKNEILLQQKNNPNKSEFEIMKELGYLKIYDCGSAKYELKLEQSDT